MGTSAASVFEMGQADRVGPAHTGPGGAQRLRPGDQLAGPSACLKARMSPGEVRQQPPIQRAPAWCQWRAASASERPVSSASP
eukprot:gene12073-16263_t